MYGATINKYQHCPRLNLEMASETVTAQDGAEATAIPVAEAVLAALSTEAIGLLRKEMFWGSLVRNYVDPTIFTVQNLK
jgi:hypothetical protein